jgi:hypothetical protein
VGARELAEDLTVSLVEKPGITYHPIKDLHEAFEVRPRHLIRVCDAVLDGEVEAKYLAAIGFCIVASDYFRYDTDAPEGELVGETVRDWSEPRVSYPLTIENVRKFRERLVTGRIPFERRVQATDRGMIERFSLVLLLVLAVAGSPGCQRLSTREQTAIVRNTPSAALLSGITERGRQLAEYDAAAWQASDALVAAGVQLEGRVQGYVARRGPAGWVVSFGQLSDGRDTYRVVYEAEEDPATPHGFRIIRHEPAKAVEGFEVFAARAVQRARDDFGTPPRPYNWAVLPDPQKQAFWVYATPAQVQEGVYLHGGDVRYQVSLTGDSILERRRLHTGILEMSPAPGAHAGMHTALVDDVPEDTDVFYVLSRRPLLPEIVVTEHYMYEINTDGSILWQRR